MIEVVDSNDDSGTWRDVGQKPTLQRIEQIISTSEMYCTFVCTRISVSQYQTGDTCKGFFTCHDTEF